ncbi:MAG: alpha/beta fold hydrolase [Actinomycetota bacterium]|nr:alpha/beta fold hydrolase [Actinomycetota bacterium]
MLSGVWNRGWETLVFWAATSVALLHALDDAFLSRQPGVPLGQHALAAAISLLAGIGAMVAFPRTRPGLRALVAFVFGVLAVVNGAQHALHAATNELARSDVTGIAALAAGAFLLVLALVIPFRHRGERAATRRQRWRNRVIATVGVAAIVVFVAVPVATGIAWTHKYREPIGDPPSAAFQPVTFTSSDGLRLSGWYAPSKNGAALILVHGGGGDRTGPRRHAELFARHGYGVLLYDARGRGESEGTPNALGWEWEKDVDGALAYLAGRGDVDDGQIGALGLSTGADVLLEAAADQRQIKAVVAEGASIRSFEDYRNAGLDALAPFSLVLMTAVRVFSGSAPGEPLAELVREISPTPLLFIAGGRGATGPGGGEYGLAQLYANAAREPVEFWGLPEGRHTAAIRERPEEYERRVVGFFDDALLDRDNP